MGHLNRSILLALLSFVVLSAAVSISLEGVAVTSRGISRKPVATKPKPVATRPKPVVKRPKPKPVSTKKPIATKKPMPKPGPTKRPVPVHVPAPRKPTHSSTKTSPTHVPPKTAHPQHTSAPHAGNSTSHGASCPLPSKKPAKPTKPRELLDYVSSFFLKKRATEEFIGWHGTNSATADTWERAGYLKKPWSWLDIIGQRRTGGSGADQELGSGLYVTDSLGTAEGFANINAGQSHNSGTVAMVCAIFAYDKTEWRADTPKAWLPNNLVGDSSNDLRHRQYEDYRVQWLERVYPTVHPADVVRFAPLDRNRGTPPGQLVIPSSRTRDFFARCVEAGSSHLPAGVPRHDPDFDLLRNTWRILDRTCV